MRLICPNCDAQYEVPPEVMPKEGRDVQCSNCGLTWFQQHPDHPIEDASDSGEKTADASATTEPDSSSQSDTAPEDPAPAPQQMPAQPDQTAPADPATQRRELDPSIADVLRAEAEMEARARRKDASAVESQPDLGLPDPKKSKDRPTSKPLTYPMPALDTDNEYEAEPPEFLAEPSTTAGAPREMFPDIEEINSTLRSNNDRSPDDDSGQTAQIEEHEKRNSRLGFSLTLVLAAALALAYVFAPQVVDAIPQAEGFMASYVATVDTWRAWLDTQISALLTWLDAAAQSSAE